jgi:hypothetical protein
MVRSGKPNTEPGEERDRNREADPSLAVASEAVPGESGLEAD